MATIESGSTPSFWRRRASRWAQVHQLAEGDALAIENQGDRVGSSCGPARRSDRADRRPRNRDKRHGFDSSPTNVAGVRRARVHSAGFRFRQRNRVGAGPWCSGVVISRNKSLRRNWIADFGANRWDRFGGRCALRARDRIWLARCWSPCAARLEPRPAFSETPFQFATWASRRRLGVFLRNSGPMARTAYPNDRREQYLFLRRRR